MIAAQSRKVIGKQEGVLVVRIGLPVRSPIPRAEITVRIERGECRSLRRKNLSSPGPAQSVRRHDDPASGQWIEATMTVLLKIETVHEMPALLGIMSQPDESGEPPRTRTLNLVIKSHLLYHLS